MTRPDSRSRSRRHRWRRRRSAALAAALLAAAGTAGFVAATRDRPPPPVPAAPPPPARGPQRTTLVAMMIGTDISGQADSLTLFGVDRLDASVLLVPAGTLGVIPGEGEGRIGKALAFGKPTLQAETVSMLLGVEVEAIVVIDDAALAGLIDALGGIDIEVTERLVSLETGEQVMPLGPRHMTGSEAVGYLTFRGGGETELERFPRARKVWEGIFVAAGDPVGRRAAAGLLDHLVGDPTGADALGRLLRASSAVAPEGRRYDELPVEAEGEDTYTVSEVEMRALIEERFGRSLREEGQV